MISVVLIMLLSIWVPYVYGDMMEKEMQKGDMMEGKMMEGEMSAMLMGTKDHNASGKVALTQDRSGKTILMLTDIKVDKVPDGRVYLAKDGDYTKGVELGKLKQFTGTVEFPIPAGVNPHDYNSVVIWCKKFSVEIGRAFFETSMMEKGGMMEKEKGMMK
jgi:hypothetical protein